MNILALILSLLFLYGCPSSGGGSSPTGPTTSAPPTIASLLVSPTPVSVGYGGGAASVIVSVDYYDTDGDIENYTTIATKKDTSGNIISGPTTTTMAFTTSLTGKTSGTASGTLGIGDTTYAHTTTFDVYFTDKAGNKSNTLTGTWKVQ